MIARRKAQWIGHLGRMQPHRMPRAALFGTLPHRTHPKGSGTKGWRKGRYPTQVQGVIDLMPGIDSRTWATQAMSRENWKESVRKMNAEIKAPNVYSDMQCPLCEYEASNAKALRGHINLEHPSGEKHEFKCPSCGKAYRRKWAMQEHIASAHPEMEIGEQRRSPAEKKEKCKFCMKGFALGHVRKHHEEYDCLSRPDSGAVLDPRGRPALLCSRCECSGLLWS